MQENDPVENWPCLNNLNSSKNKPSSPKFHMAARARTYKVEIRDAAKNAKDFFTVMK